MPVTRMQTGHIPRRKYHALTLQMDSITLLSPVNSPTKTTPTPIRSTFRKSGPGSPTKVTKNVSFRKSTRKTSLSGSAAETKRYNNAAKNVNAEVPIIPNTIPNLRTRKLTAKLVAAKVTEDEDENVAKPMKDVCEGSTFFPSVAFGEREIVGLSQIGRADKEVEMWKEILEAHKVGLPRLVPVCQKSLDQAKAVRASLEETEENLRIGDQNPAEKMIKQRLETLEWGLSTSRFGPEKDNIQGAIAAYKSGEIDYSEHYSLIWAGKVVDRAANYGDMVRDRTERLDRYAVAHGPHWLWWEPPLKLHPESQPRMSASVGLERLNEPHKLGQWYIKQGFWKRHEYVTRMPSTADSRPAPQDPYYARNEFGQVYTGFEGPKLAFRSLLDSGATYPSLHTDDFVRLGIVFDYYGAQSIQTFHTANGDMNSRIFEMSVCVLDDNGLQLVDPNDAVWPAFNKYLGGLCPVTECVTPLQYDAQGIEITGRLSGLLPFVACYISSTPTRNKLYLGEDRNDVLGAHRMPGHKKWDIAIPHDKAANPYGIPDADYGNPHITFSHREGRILNEDDPVTPHASLTTFMKGTEQETILRVNPKQDTINLRARKAAATSLQALINQRAQTAREEGLFDWNR